MCSARSGAGLRRTAAAAWGLALTAVPALHAQETRGVVDARMYEAARTRFEAVDARYRWASERVERRRAGDAARQRGYFEGRLDSVRVGPFQVVARTGELGRAAGLVADAWWEFEPLHGGSPPPGGTRTPTLAMVHPGDSLGRALTSLDLTFQEARWSAGRFRWQPRPVRDLVQVLRQSIPAALRSWTTPAALQPSFPWDQAARALLLSRSPRGAECVAGRHEACMDILALPGLAASPGEVEERSEFIRIQRSRLARLYPGESWLRLARSMEASGACGPGVSAPACLERLSTPRYQAVVRAVEAPARDAVLRVALELGGPEAVFRLISLEDGTSLDEALEAVAGVPVSRVVTRWRERLLDEDAGDRPLPRPGGALLWTAALGLCSLTSTRWRA